LIEIKAQGVNIHIDNRKVQKECLSQIKMKINTIKNAILWVDIILKIFQYIYKSLVIWINLEVLIFWF
jgi:hypothetical protein